MLDDARGGGGFFYVRGVGGDEGSKGPLRHKGTKDVRKGLAFGSSGAGENEGVQGGDRPGSPGEVGGLAVGFRAQGGKDAGGVWGQGGGCDVHLGQFT